VSRYIKKTRGKNILSVAVEPAESPVLNQRRAGEPLKPADTYFGIMYSNVNGGLSNGYLARNDLDPTVGLRFRF
jgi:cysteine synthase